MNCLRSAPLDKTGDALQLNGLKYMVEFQSDLSYLKDPPPGYLYPPVDILGRLDELSVRLQSDFYTNEYDFQVDIFKLVNAAYDGHFVYAPDITLIFSYVRLNSSNFVNGLPDLFQLYSVSPDGIGLPSVYGFQDQVALAGLNSSTYKPSPIIQINGEDVEEYLNHWAIVNGNGLQQEPDANVCIRMTLSIIACPEDTC